MGLIKDEENAFGGALVWLTDWDIWSETIERVGLELLRGVRNSDNAVRETPAHLFEPSEQVGTHVLLSLIMLFQWDAFLIPPVGRTIVRASHDGYVEISANSPEDMTFLKAWFEDGQWAVQ
jgi:hypothetical protein